MFLESFPAVPQPLMAQWAHIGVLTWAKSQPLSCLVEAEEVFSYCLTNGFSTHIVSNKRHPTECPEHYPQA